MNLGDVAEISLPNMTLVSAPQAGGVVSTRSFIPYRRHATIGVFAVVSVATARTMPGMTAAEVVVLPKGETFAIKHPTGAAEVLLERDVEGAVRRAGSLRTARKHFDGRVFPRA